MTCKAEWTLFVHNKTTPEFDKCARAVVNSSAIFPTWDAYESMRIQNLPLGDNGWFQGTTTTLAPRSHKQRIWLVLIPQSIATIVTSPVSLNTWGFCNERTATLKITNKIISPKRNTAIWNCNKKIFHIQLGWIKHNFSKIQHFVHMLFVFAQVILTIAIIISQLMLM